MKKTIPKLLTLVCLLVAVMGLSIVTAHAATVTGTISGGNEYRYHEDKTPVSQWGPYTSNKLKYFTRNDTGETVPAYCMEPEVRSASGDLQYSSTSWSDLTWNQRYAVTLAMAYGYGGNYGFNMHPDCAQLATQAVVWEFVCGYRSPVYLRRKRNLTLEQMSSALNISIDHLSRIELGKRGASIDLTLDIANLLDVSVDFLVRGTSRMSPSTKKLIDQIRELLDGFEAM